MTPQPIESQALWPLGVYFVAVVIILAGMIGLSYVLGERHREKQTAEPYESGIVSTGSARVRFDIKFYLIAMFFVIFDLEAVFIFAWAVSLRESGWPGYIEIMIFIGVLAATLVYLWRVKALEWGSYVKNSTKYRVQSTK
jgi:NADH-quinone oxidoreductase subunit A